MGTSELGIAISPKVAKMAVSASKSGMPAATRLPKTTTRMISVTGSESMPAFARSSRKAPSICLSVLASPNSPTKYPGFARWMSAIASTTGLIFDGASIASPLISKSTSAARPFGEIWASLPVSVGERTFSTKPNAETFATTSATTALNAGSFASTVWLWISTVSPAGCWKPASRIRSARPDSPTPDVLLSILVAPIMLPTTNATTTNPSHPKIAVFR